MAGNADRKEARKKEAQKHLGLVKGLFATETARTIEGAVLYEDGEGRDLPIPEARFETTQVSVEWEDGAHAAAKAKGKVCLLDPASYTKPGGNYLSGSWSPEEQLCAESNLFCILEGLKESYYDENRQSTHGGLFSDRALYLADVMFTTGGAMKKRDVLVVAPPNRRFALENHRSEAECDLDLANRVKAVMTIAAANEVDALVLCAFGCGFFGNADAQVAGLFKAWLDEHPGVFEQVVFAIPGGPALDVFRDVFDAHEAAPAVFEEVPDDDEDEDDWLPETDEDGRWTFGG